MVALLVFNPFHAMVWYIGLRYISENRQGPIYWTTNINFTLDSLKIIKPWNFMKKLSINLLSKENYFHCLSVRYISVFCELITLYVNKSQMYFTSFKVSVLWRYISLVQWFSFSLFPSLSWFTFFCEYFDHKYKSKFIFCM